MGKWKGGTTRKFYRNMQFERSSRQLGFALFALCGPIALVILAIVAVFAIVNHGGNVHGVSLASLGAVPISMRGRSKVEPVPNFTRDKNPYRLSDLVSMSEHKFFEVLRNFGVSGGSTPAQWQQRKLAIVPYIANQKQVIDLRKYETDGVFDRLIVKITGSITGAVGAGATGVDNPEGLLQNAQLVVTPSAQGLVPINQVSGRTLLYDRAMEDGFVTKAASIPNTATANPVNCEWHMVFQRRRVKNGIEHAFDIGRYTGATLNLTFGDLTTINGAGGSPAGAFAACNIEIWGIINYNVQPKYLHAVELFENIYPVLATQSSFLIDNLPNGAYYPDLVVLAEGSGLLAGNNILSNNIANSFDLSSGSRSWLMNGDLNADFIQRSMTHPIYDGNSVFTSDDPVAYAGAQKVTGQYALTRLCKLQGLLTKAPDALVSQLLIRVNETFTGTTGFQQLRLFGRKVVPGGVYKAPAKGGSGSASAPGSAA